MGVNLGAITSKLDAYAKSSVGRARMSKTIKDYVRDNNKYVTTNGKTLGGDRIITQQEMRDVARELVFYIKQAAASCDLPVSVMEHIESKGPLYTLSCPQKGKSQTKCSPTLSKPMPHQMHIQDKKIYF
jgi:hypothetical protein